MKYRANILIYNLTEKGSKNIFTEIVGEDMRWLSNTWDASHMNVQEKLVLIQNFELAYGFSTFDTYHQCLRYA